MNLPPDISPRTVAEIANRLVLGTAQLTADYGIANVSGAPERREALSLLSFAWESGIRRFDTAPAYNSEKILGDFVAAHGLGADVRILTKISAIEPGTEWRDYIRRSVEESLQRLRVSGIDVLFFHRFTDSKLLATDEGFFRRLFCEFPIRRIGISVYEPEDIGDDGGFEIAYQFPANLFDRRFASINLPIGRRYARSIFLQGVLASAGALRTTANAGLVDLHRNYHQYLAKAGLDPLAIAVSAVARRAWIDYAILGVERSEQLEKILKTTLIGDPEGVIPEQLVRDAQTWLDPRKW